MSAYIVSDATIDAIINHYRHDHRSNDFRGWLSLYTDEISGLDGNEIWSMFGNKLRAMNERAIVARYGEDSLILMTGGDKYVPYVYSNTTPRPLCQVYGSLGCYLYQCSEGNVPNKELYKALDHEHNKMAHDLIRDLARRADVTIPWGIEEA